MVLNSVSKICPLLFTMYNKSKTILSNSQDVSERRIRFTSNSSARYLLEKIETAVTEMGFSVQKKHAKVSLHNMLFLFLCYFGMLVLLSF